jgi:hypothetical protein
MEEFVPTTFVFPVFKMKIGTVTKANENMMKERRESEIRMKSENRREWREKYVMLLFAIH